MTSLTRHLREPESHGRLAFHPDCPICRQSRLTGTLLTTNLRPSLRTQAALTTSMLAVGVMAPAASVLAAEPDQEQSGTASVTQNGAPDPAANPDFDPGGNSTSLPDTGPPPAAQRPPDNPIVDTGPVEPEPTTNPTEPVVDDGDGSGMTTNPTPPAAGVAPAPPSALDASQPTDPASPAATAAPAPAAAPPPSAQPPEPTAADTAPTRPVPPVQRGDDRERSQGRDTVVTSPPAVRTTTPAAAAPAAMPAVSSTSTTASSNARAKPGDRTHTVQPGESLWAIAAGMLGPDATMAQIAREVNHLWTLNSERIGTGDPDLLMIGTRLVLR